MAQHELSNKEIIVRLLKSDLSDYDNLLSLLGMANEVIREDKELSRKLANKVRFLALRLCATGDIKYYDLYNKALLFLAQEHKDFDSYLLYVEKNRDPEDRYYQPRRNKIYWLVQKMQRLIDDELDILSISMPPGTGKTTLGEFFISFVMGHYPNTSNLMSSHSGFMTRMFYDAVLNIITSNEYCWSDVFPDIVFEGNNAKEETINLGRWQPFKTLTCRPIRGSLTGVTRCEGFLYVDDLVSGIEEALSIDRLDKLYGEYTTDLKSRKKKKAKEIHIATRWSVHDVIGRLERMYEGNPRAEFIAVPDIDPQTGKSNFDYDYDVGFDEKYFHDMEMSMDDVSYRCLYKSDPIEREGILYHPTELQRYIGGLPDREPDSILAICDTKDTGTDYNFLGVFYQYGDRYYLEDLVFKNIDPGTLDELNSDMLVKHHVQQAQFESNKEGSRTANEVIQHMIVNYIEPIFEHQFIYHSYACRKGKGAHRASKQLTRWLYNLEVVQGKSVYVLKADIHHYFQSIDHKVLKREIRTYIKDKDLLVILDRIIDHNGIFPDGVGIPVGNLTSQLFANVYLHRLDMFVKHTLHAEHYMRYMDDFVIISEDLEQLKRWEKQIEIFLADVLKLQLNPKTTIVYAKNGVDFVGYRHWNSTKKIRKDAMRRLKRLMKNFKDGTITEEFFDKSFTSRIGSIKHADTYNLVQKITCEAKELKESHA